ncbi:MAG: type II secretion system secretin GspD [Candidatus Thiodiazotropha sp. 6PLUC2]
MLIKYTLPTLLLLFITGCSNLNSKSDDEASVAVKNSFPPGHLLPGGAQGEQDAGLKTFDQEKPKEKQASKDRTEIFYGTGQFVKSDKSIDKAAASAPAGDITLNFEKADLREVIQTILGELLDESYILDPAVKGNVTIQTGKSLSRADLLPTLETLLRMNNAAMVHVDGVYRVLPLGKAVQGQKVPRLADSSAPIPAGYALQIVPLEYIGAREMAEILQPLAPKESIIRVDAVRNLLVMGGTGAEMAGLLETVNLFDVDWIKGLSVGFFPLKYAKVSTVTKELQAIVGSIDSNPLQGMFRIVPIDDADGILVVTPQKRYLDRVAEWIPRLDRVDTQDAGTGQRLYVYRVQNGDAEDLANMLQQLFSSAASTRTKNKSAKVAPGKTKKTLSSSTDSESKTVSSTSVTRMTLTGTVGDSSDKEIRVVADAKHNSLVITATPSQYASMLEALEKLDQRQLQVMVEATIIEVALTDSLRYGLQWAFNGGVDGDNFTGIGGLTLGTETANFGTTLAYTLPGFNFSLLRNASDVRAIFSALSEDTLVRVLSSPSLMVLDNETASIQVGDQVPVVTTQQQSTTDSTASLINNVSYRDTGVMLEVTPRVNPGGLVTLEVSQEVSDASTTTSSTVDSPTISTRKIESTVAVQNGEALILGGLIRDQGSSGSSGLPFLSNLPLIGWLFGQESDSSRRTELVVVLVPTVVSDSSDNRKVVESFRRKLEGLKGTF